MFECLEQAITELEPQFRHLIGENAKVVTGTDIMSMLNSESNRPNWRRIMLEIFQSCCDPEHINEVYVFKKIKKALLNEEGGFLVLIDHQEWQDKHEIIPLSFIIIENIDLSYLVSEDKGECISLICSRRAVSKETMEKKGRGFGYYLMSVYLKATLAKTIVLEVINDSKIKEGQPYGHGTPKNSKLLNWYLSFGFYEDPKFAIGDDPPPMYRNKIYQVPEINKFNGTSYFLRTLVLRR